LRPVPRQRHHAFAITEWQCTVTYLLYGHVPLAGNQDDVIRARLTHGPADSLPTVMFDVQFVRLTNTGTDPAIMLAAGLIGSNAGTLSMDLNLADNDIIASTVGASVLVGAMGGNCSTTAARSLSNTSALPRPAGS